MTTTKIKLDPQIAITIDAVKRAHAKSGAPGRFLALLEESQQYFVQLTHGVDKFKYHTRGNKLTVTCSWSIGGDYQRKQATVEMGK